jgi:hypothetical protein
MGNIMIYKNQWEEFKQLNNRGMLLLVSIPISLLVAAIISKINVFLFYLCLGGIPLEFGMLIYTLIKIRAFLCPACSKSFTVKYPFGPNTFGGKCVHCGLKVNE